MDAFYYYKRNENKAPIWTTCFVTDGETWARGTALCSVNDNPCKKTGKKIAYSRAMEAFHRQKDEEGCDVKAYGDFWKCAFMPELNEIECKFMGIVTP